MIKSQVEVSSLCNMSCPICAHSFLKRKQGFMTLELWKKIVIDTKKNKHQIEYIHHQGEPLLWPYLIEGIKFLTENELQTQISTNGILLTTDLANRLYEAGQKEIIVAIDTMNPAAYEKIRGPEFILNKIKNNIHEVLNKTNLKIKAQFMPTKYNSDETIEAFNEFKSDNFSVDDWFVIRLDGAKDVSKNLNHTKNELNKSICDKLFERLVVLWTGECVLCCIDVHGEMIIGNLNINSIDEVFYSKKANDFRTRIRNNDLPETCKNCFADHIVLHNLS